MQATVVPASANASAAPSPDRRLERRPAWNRLRGEARPARCARRPGRGWPGTPSGAPVAARASARSRSASNASRGPHPRQPAGRAAAAGAARARSSFSARFGNSLTPVIGVRAGGQPLRPLRPRGARSARATSPESQRRGQPAGPLDLGEPLPRRRCASSSVSDSTYQEPPAGSSTRARCASSTSRRLGVAGDPAGEGVGQPERGVERQHGDASAPPDAGGEAGDRGAQHVHPRVAPGHHRPTR